MKDLIRVWTLSLLSAGLKALVINPAGLILEVYMGGSKGPSFWRTDEVDGAHEGCVWPGLTVAYDLLPGPCPPWHAVRSSRFSLSTENQVHPGRFRLVLYQHRDSCILGRRIRGVPAEGERGPAFLWDREACHIKSLLGHSAGTNLKSCRGKSTNDRGSELSGSKRSIVL